MDACENNSNCNCFSNSNCNGLTFYISKGVAAYSRGSCLWQKGIFTYRPNMRQVSYLYRSLLLEKKIFSIYILKGLEVPNGCFLIHMIGGFKNSWSLGSCTGNSTDTRLPVYREVCCLPNGNYTLTCRDFYGIGWNGGYIMGPRGNRYCEGFINGFEKKESIQITAHGMYLDAFSLIGILNTQAYFIAYLYLGNYTFLMDNYCDGKHIQSHQTLHSAQTACEKNNECKCIYDSGCEGTKWHAMTGSAISTGVAGEYCAWMKGTLIVFLMLEIGNIYPFQSIIEFQIQLIKSNMMHDVCCSHKRRLVRFWRLWSLQRTVCGWLSNKT